MAYFQTKNPNLGKLFEGLEMEDVGMFYGHLVYFTLIWSILWSFGICLGYLVYFSTFWYVVPRKIWQPCFPAVPSNTRGYKYYTIRQRRTLS
jgi:hypothetical protein